MRAALALVFALLAAAASAAPVEDFVAVNGVRLQYLDWGGAGPALVLVHGLADNPHVFDDLAPAFVDRFHVIAYARRGSGSSDALGPYDVATLMQDLLGFMDAQKIASAALVGVSAGGEEITRLAAEHPERVRSVVYLDGGYDFASAEFRAAVAARPFSAFDRPAHAMASLDGFRAYMKTMWYPRVDDIRRMDGNLRGKVVIQRDGTLQDRTSKAVVDASYSALWANEPRPYARIQCPALAIYAERYYDVDPANQERLGTAAAYEARYWHPFQASSVARIRRDLRKVEILHVPGGHSSFILMSRGKIVDSMRRFLSRDSSGAAHPPSR